MWALGLVYCAEYNTGGHISGEVLLQLVALPPELRGLVLLFVDLALQRS